LNLAAKIDRLDTKLTKFEENEIDKRLQLELRVASIEQHLGLQTHIKVCSVRDALAVTSAFA
jgi:hypothetical protein